MATRRILAQLLKVDHWMHEEGSQCSCSSHPMQSQSDLSQYFKMLQDASANETKMRQKWDKNETKMRQKWDKNETQSSRVCNIYGHIYGHIMQHLANLLTSGMLSKRPSWKNIPIIAIIAKRPFASSAFNLDFFAAGSETLPKKVGNPTSSSRFESGGKLLNIFQLLQASKILVVSTQLVLE